MEGWPLVGRADELELIQERLLGRQAVSIVIAGAGGVGKSRLAREVTALAVEAGLPTAEAAASKAASSIPFGALAQLLPDDDRPSQTPAALLRRASTAIAARSAGRRLVLWVDDAHALDDASSVLLHQLARDDCVALVLTVRTGEPAPDAVELIWKDGLAERIELQPLARNESDELVAAALDGDVDGVLADRLWQRSLGNPLYLRELIRNGRETGAFVEEGGLWRLRGDLPAPQRLVELLARHLDGLGRGGLATLELAAVAGELGLAALESACGRDPVARLEEAGWLSVGTDDRRRPARPAHPLYAEILRERMPAARTRELQLQVADLLESFGARRRGDLLRVAVLRLDAEGSVGRDLLAKAAADAYFTYDFSLAERVARSALDAGAGWETRRLLAEILRYAGKHDQAEDVLASIGPGQLRSDKARGLVGLARAENLFRGLGRRHEARRVLADAQRTVGGPWRREMAAIEASFDLMTGDVGGAVAQIEPLLDGPADRGTASACSVGALALALAGRCDRAVAVADKGFEIALSLGPQPLVNDPATHIVMRCFADVVAGRLAAVEERARPIYDWVVASGISLGQAWLGLVLGYAALGSGRLGSAEHLFREAAVASDEVSDPGLERWAWSGAAQACAERGDVPGAEACLERMDDRRGRPVEITLALQVRARAWTAAARGEHSGARRMLIEGAVHARIRGQHALEAELLHDVVRLGDASATLPRFEELGGVVDGPVLPLRIEHARALAAGDGDGLSAVSSGIEAAGYVLAAAEASAQAARTYRSAGRSRLATAAVTRTVQLLERCEGASTPALLDATEPAPLTDREQEIAALAARGLTSREIADRLVVSVRTVENHLQRAYEKLGVGSRRELADRLR